VAIQLAEDFRFPAAGMAQAIESQSGEPEQSPQVVAAMQGIIDTFHRALAANTITQEPDGAVETVVSPDGEETRMIHPEPASLMILNQADEQFRTMFGDDAYNRHCLNSMLEVRLPPQSDGNPR